MRHTIGHDYYDVGAGTWVMVPPGAPHTFANPGDDPAKDMVVEAGQPMTRDSIAEVWAKYATEPSAEYAP